MTAEDVYAYVAAELAKLTIPTAKEIEDKALAAVQDLRLSVEVNTFHLSDNIQVKVSMNKGVPNAETGLTDRVTVSSATANRNHIV